MINIRKYNYYSWIGQLENEWAGRVNFGLRILDIGCGDGEFLKMLLKRGIGVEGVGIDLGVAPNGAASRHRSLGMSLLWGDLCDRDKIPVVHEIDTAFFMNMFYVLPTLGPVEEFLDQIKSPNLVISVPNGAALRLFDRRNPGVNFYDRDLDSFIARAGYRVYGRKPVTRRHYLAQPFGVLVGSLSKLSAGLLESFGDDPYYELLWCKRI